MVTRHDFFHRLKHWNRLVQYNKKQHRKVLLDCFDLSKLGWSWFRIKSANFKLPLLNDFEEGSRCFRGGGLWKILSKVQRGKRGRGITRGSVKYIMRVIIRLIRPLIVLSTKFHSYNVGYIF